jgi:hypothetical protein
MNFWREQFLATLAFTIFSDDLTDTVFGFRMYAGMYVCMRVRMYVFQQNTIENTNTICTFRMI